MAPVVRRARPGEYRAIGQLTASAYAEVLAEGDSDPYRAVLLDARDRADRAELLVATDEQDRLQGTVTIGRPGGPYAQLAGPCEVEVRMLAVLPGLARTGIGRALMDDVHALAAREGYRATVLCVIASNTAAADFYRALGYRRQPERDWLPRSDMTIPIAGLRPRRSDRHRLDPHIPPGVLFLDARHPRSQHMSPTDTPDRHA